MEVGILQTISSLEKSFNSNGRLSLDGIAKNVLDVKLASQSKPLVELDLYNDQDDEGEVMLLAMILLQLHGVKLPTTEDDGDLLNKKKRQRTSPDQLAILEQIFQTDKMPNQQTRVQLADQLGMSSRRVQIWFQNKRAKVKRSVSKQDGEPDSPSSLNQSSSSISSPSSPSSPSLSNESPVPSPIPATAPLSSITQQPLQTLNATLSTLLTTTPSPITTSTTSTTPAATSIIDATTKHLKAQQLQFSLKAPFADNQPVLTASY